MGLFRKKAGRINNVNEYVHLPRKWGVEMKGAVKRKKRADSVKAPGAKATCCVSVLALLENQEEMLFFRFQASGRDNSIK